MLSVAVFLNKGLFLLFSAIANCFAFFASLVAILS
jgi:hypothetical protein